MSARPPPRHRRHEDGVHFRAEGHTVDLAAHHRQLRGPFVGEFHSLMMTHAVVVYSLGPRRPVKRPREAADDVWVTLDSMLPSRAGPVPDRLTIWPIDDGRYGLDATFQGSSGYQRAQVHQVELERDEVPHAFRQEPDGGWTLRFGPLPAADVARALSVFVY
jgi:hypothetical protein